MFLQEPISDHLFTQMWGKSFKEYCTVDRADLRHLHVLHTGFDGQDHVGHLVCHKLIAQPLLDIFQQLHAARYPIEKMVLIDHYDADDERSMTDNNSSCFNFRYISYTTQLSNHAQGLAVDINPLYNPYVKMVEGRLSIEPANGAPYVDRTADFPYKIGEDDLCYRLFTQAGFEWGGHWTHALDYQHFEWYPQPDVAATPQED